MIEQWTKMLLSNFSLFMFILAIIVSLIIKIFSDIKMSEIMLRWVTLLAVGVTGVYTFVLHAFFPAISANTIGWTVSPFQYEVAIADLTIGVLGLFAYRATLGFRLATVLATTIWLWGDAIGHIHQMIIHYNYANGNAGSWFWMDFLIPLTLIITYRQSRSTC